MSTRSRLAKFPPIPLSTPTEAFYHQAPDPARGFPKGGDWVRMGGTRSGPRSPRLNMPRRRPRRPSSPPPRKRPAPPKQVWPARAAGGIAAAVILILIVWLVVAGRGGSPRTNPLEEGTAHLAAGRAAQAERALRKAARVDPGNVRPWVLVLEILRVEDRRLEAMKLGWEALGRVAPKDRPAILRQITLACLMDVPDEVARTALNRWIDADPNDFEAETALLRRIGANPRAEDPDRRARVARLEEIVAAHPDQPNPREALIVALADGGEAERGRAVLDAWPADARDARYHRLLGRWELEYDRRAERAVEALRRALETLPHDWPTHYRLARALSMLGRREEAQREAEAVARIREAIDPATLGPTLDAAFSKLDEPRARASLAELCDRVGLARLAQAWLSAGSASAALGSGTTRPIP